MLLLLLIQGRRDEDDYYYYYRGRDAWVDGWMDGWMEKQDHKGRRSISELRRTLVALGKIGLFFPLLGVCAAVVPLAASPVWLLLRCMTDY